MRTVSLALFAALLATPVLAQAPAAPPPDRTKQSWTRLRTGVSGDVMQW